MKEIHGIHDIFRREKNGDYTRNALLYQDILSYFFVISGKSSHDGSFRFYDLAKWLIDHNMEFVNYYKDLSTRNITMSNRIEARKERIKSKLSDLINLGLVLVSGKTKAATTDANIDLYKYLEDGQLVAWLLKSMDLAKPENADNQIFKILSSILEKNGSSDSLFSLAIINTMKENMSFGSFANLLRRAICDGTPIRNVFDLLSAVRVPDHLKEAAKNNPESAIRDLHTVIKGMNSQRRKLFFHQVKLDLENQMQKKLENPAEYEKLRFTLKNEPWLVATEARCKNCKCIVHIAAELLPYMELRVAQRASMVYDCPSCTKERTVFIPIL